MDTRSHGNVKCKGKVGSLTLTSNSLTFSADDGAQQLIWPWSKVEKHMVKSVTSNRHLIKIIFRDSGTAPVILDVATLSEVDQIRKDISSTRDRFSASTTVPAPAPGRHLTSSSATVDIVPGTNMQDEKRKIRAQTTKGETLVFLPKGKTMKSKESSTHNEKVVLLSPVRQTPGPNLKSQNIHKTQRARKQSATTPTKDKTTDKQPARNPGNTTGKTKNSPNRTSASEQTRASNSDKTAPQSPNRIASVSPPPPVVEASTSVLRAMEKEQEYNHADGPAKIEANAEEPKERLSLDSVGGPNSVLRAIAKEQRHMRESARPRSSAQRERVSSAPRSQARQQTRQSASDDNQATETSQTSPPTNSHGGGRVHNQPRPGAMRVSGINGASSDDFDNEDPPHPSSQRNLNPTSAEDVLVEAQLVEGSSRQLANAEDAGDLVQAEPLQEKELRCRDAWRSRRMRRAILIAAFAMIAIIVAIILAFTLTRGGRGNSEAVDSSIVAPTHSRPTPSPASYPTEEKFKEVDLARVDPNTGILFFLVDWFEGDPPTSLVDAVKNPTSPQSLAQKWLIDDMEQGGYEQDSQVQRFALATFYFATNGESWNSDNSWLDHNVHECEWFQHEEACPEEDEVVTQLTLVKHGLSGSVPPEVFWLNIAWLDLSRNPIEGTIPTEIGMATDLTILVLESTSIRGALPLEIGQLRKAEFVSFAEVALLSGTIPPEIGQMAALEGLTISSTRIEGSIPTQVGKLMNMEELNLLDNNLQGMTPSQIGLMTNLHRLNLSINPELAGTLPSELGLLSNLSWLGLTDTSLGGSIPPEVCSLGNLKVEVEASVEAC